MTHSRDKHWEFFVSAHEVVPVVLPVISTAFTGPDAEHNDARVERLADFVQTMVWCDSIEFTHDPEHAEDPEIDRDSLTAALGRLFVDAHEGDGKPSARALFNDDFADPAWVTGLIGRLAEAVAVAVAEQRIEVRADEPYDSCAGCGGYHNVNYDCSRDDADDD